MAKLITRSIISLVLVVNVILLVFGVHPIDIDESALFGAVSVIVAVADRMYNTWKNFNVTPEAITAQSIKDALSEGATLVDYLEAIKNNK